MPYIFHAIEEICSGGDKEGYYHSGLTGLLGSLNIAGGGIYCLAIIFFILHLVRVPHRFSMGFLYHHGRMITKLVSPMGGLELAISFCTCIGP